MALTFTKATKEQAKLRLAIFGPSGSGKTYTSLRIATGIGGKIAVIDTERGSASKYADRFEFDVLELPKNDIATYTQGIRAAQAAGYEVLIIDSLTHAWKDLLQQVDKWSSQSFGGNRWAGWSKGTPAQMAFVETILGFGGHLIGTMRTKTEWASEVDTRTGKTKPVRIGLLPEQGKGIEYEFDMLIEIDVNHNACVIKDRTGQYQDEVIAEPGEALGEDLRKWLSSGAKPLHWFERGDTADKFWAFGESKLKTREAVLEALEVADMRDYTGNKQAAVDAITAAAEKLTEPKTETETEPTKEKKSETVEEFLARREPGPTEPGQFNPEQPDLPCNDYQGMFLAAVKVLRYNAVQHVKNALKQEYGEGGTASVRDSWAFLKKHKEEKETA
ncbi:MAG: ATP-binding protein [Gammaproteobacteria bacterium]|nr:ATP-binding protein [Gammaproteobacteria bacterium]